MSGTSDWKYLPVVNACIRILLTVGGGALAGRAKLFDQVFVTLAAKFVFHIALPCLVVRGLGIFTDFYSDDFIWVYICAFLVLRGIALFLVCIGVVLTPLEESSQGIGQIAVVWLSLTWISTVILGIPILTAVLGSPVKGAFYGLLAGISSFIFQLPFELCFLECDALEKELKSSKRASSIPTNVRQLPGGTGSLEGGEAATNVEESAASDLMALSRWRLWLSLASRREVWHRISWKLLLNPVIIGLFWGFLISLSTLGPTYLNPTSEDFVHGLGWVTLTLEWLGDCVSPLSLFAMGVWMSGRGLLLAQEVKCLTIISGMISKLVIAPLLMLGLALGMGLDDEASRAAVLIGSLPISMASFTLASQYEIGEGLLSANVFMGTLLMLPTVLIWNIVLDKLDLFPVDYFDSLVECPLPPSPPP